jgi:L-fuconolactonase
MLEQARQYPHIRGVVGWGDLRDPATPGELARYVGDPKFKGVRVYWEEPEESHGALDDGLRFLADHGLSCDLVVKPQSYGQIAEAMARHPGVQFILDHFAGVHMYPDGSSADTWTEAIRPLAALPNAALKLSGYMTSAHPPTPDTVRPYFAAALAQFGAERLLYGSDYPICITLGQRYADSVALVRALTAPLSEAERTAILTMTAERAYRLTR